MLIPGRYHNLAQPNDKYAFIIIRYVCLPDHDNYDGGLPGVGITWGKQKLFVPAKDEAHFWAQWPYSIFKPATHV